MSRQTLVWHAIARSLLRGFVMHCPRSRVAVIFSALVGVQLCAMHGLALAATEVRGQPGSIQLTATNATVKEVLDTLATSYKLTYKIPAGLSGDLTVRCSGSLRKILEHALVGQNYFLKVLDDSIEVVVLEASEKASAPGRATVAASSPVVTASNATTSAPVGVAPAAGPSLPQANLAPPLASYLHREPVASSAR